MSKTRICLPSPNCDTMSSVVVARVRRLGWALVRNAGSPMISSLRHRRWSRLLLVVAMATLLVSAPVHAQRAAQTRDTAPAASPLPVAPRENAGMSAARLPTPTGGFRREIEDKKRRGVVMMVARKGRLVYATALGARDPKSADPMRIVTANGFRPSTT